VLVVEAVVVAVPAVLLCRVTPENQSDLDQRPIGSCHPVDDLGP
jgi:hypothetical protein